MNELLLTGTVLLYLGILLLVKRYWGLPGFYAWIAIAAILANIEVDKLIYAFGLEMTLGNVFFASQFLTTDIISETYGKRASKRAVNVGIFACVFLIIATQIMLAFVPSDNDTMQGAMEAVFSQVPQVAVASLVTYFVVQKLDVFLYHAIWSHTFKRCGKRKPYLWLRNNLATITSQLVNSFMFNFLAFWCVHDLPTLVNLSLATFIIGVVLALLDTPFLYLLRKIKIYEPNKDLEPIKD